MINYQTTARLAAAEGVEVPWNFAATMLPHPVNFGFAVPVGTDNTTVGDFSPFLNQQLEGATHKDKMASFIGTVERFRLAYYGVSIHFDGPALSNQGSVVVNQTACAPLQVFCSSKNGDDVTLARSAVCAPDSTNPAVFGSDFPNYDKSASMPNSYTGPVKDGLYIPLKLTKTCQQWRSRSDLVHWIPPTNGGPGYRFIPETATEIDYPHPGLPSLAISEGIAIDGEVTSPFLSDVVAHVCGRNISPQAALIFTFRVGIEAQVEPGTLLSPYQRVSPSYDSQALKAYFLVSRELKDAYPVDFNDLGKLWSVISAGLKAAAPALGAVHPLVGSLMTGISGVGDLIASRRTGARSAKLETASAAAKQRVRAEVAKGLAEPANLAAPGKRGARRRAPKKPSKK